MSAAVNVEPVRTLDQLLDGIAGATDVPPVEISGISSDSRQLAPGHVFLACQGLSSHGLDYVGEAVAAGVAAIVWDSRTGRDPDAAGTVSVPVAGLAGQLGVIANRWYDRPSAHMRISGVTGTNGKTTVAFLIADCLRRLGTRCAYLGTLGAGVGGQDYEPGLTTPGCIDLHDRLAGFRSEQATHAAIEVSSHALEQRRVDGVHFDSVLFTNLSRDHIDYHGSMQAYGNAKARLILEHEAAHRIINIDSEFGRELAGRCDGDVVAVSTRPFKGLRRPPYVSVCAVYADQDGSTVEVNSSWGGAKLHLPLAGHFNVANAALVLAQLLCWKVPVEDAVAVLSSVQAPPGRMQKVQADGPGPTVYIDFAHTPAGLQAALTALRNHCNGELWCVFGCGGDRDRGKRAPMGETAVRIAEQCVVTNDNPRSETPEAIIDAILSGMGGKALAIPDRSAAIAHAIGNAGDEDIVLIAGKGHENYQAIGDARLPFSDYEVARAALNRRRTAGDR